MNFLIQERSRSVKAIFAVQRRSPESIKCDSGALLYESGDPAVEGGTINNFQFRIGGRYFPASPVECTSSYGTGISNGGAEAFVELQKALNCVGDYRLSASVNTLRWAMPGATQGGTVPSATNFAVGEMDYQPIIKKWKDKGLPEFNSLITPECGNVGSTCFAMATSLETSNGVEISGLNAEEQADISLIVNYSKAQAAGYAFEVYVLYDSMLVLRENNVLELIQ